MFENASPATGNEELKLLFTATTLLSSAQTPLVIVSDLHRRQEKGESFAIGRVFPQDQQHRLSAIQRRLMILVNAFMDDFGFPMSQVSVQAALSFFQRHQQAVVPSFSAEPSGLIIATWRRGCEVLTMRFVEQDMIHYTTAVLMPDQADLQRAWGVTNVQKAGLPSFVGASFLVG
jgi:hypothetical protein